MSGIAGEGMTRGGGGDNVSIPRFILEESPTLAKKFKDFEEAEERARKATEHIGSAEEVVQLRVQVDKELSDANAVSAQARTDAQETKSVSIAEAARRVTEAEITSKKMRERAEEVFREATKVKADADSLMKESGAAATVMATTMKANESKEQQLQQRAADLDTREQELKENTARLTNLGEHIRNVLR